MYRLLHQEAPALDVGSWLNTNIPLSLARLRGKVVVLHAFQMLCPACIMQGLPQVNKIFKTFLPNDVAVIGLHTVFEHHEAMQPRRWRPSANSSATNSPWLSTGPTASCPAPCNATSSRARPVWCSSTARASFVSITSAIWMIWCSAASSAR